MVRSVKSYQRFREVFLENTYREALFKIYNYFRLSKVKEKYLYLKGIKTKFFAYRGPQVVQIDLTDNCNNNCIACWCNSPLLGKERDKTKASLSWDILKKIIYELKLLGTREIVLSGGGEPLMYPFLLEVINEIKSKKLICHLNTNFTLVDKKIIKEFLKLRLDYLTVSFWAATPKTYIRVHPNRVEDDFHRIKDNLRTLNLLKNGYPKVKIYNVIFRWNYQEIEEMLYLAESLKVDSVEFSVIDVIPEKTDCLFMNFRELSQLREICNKIKMIKQKIRIINFDLFLRRISTQGALFGEYDREILKDIPCYNGWLFSRILANGDVIPCLKAHRFPVGNIYNQDFTSIWNNELMQEFRRKAISGNKEDKFFYLIGNGNGSQAGCYCICDDLPRNIYLFNKLNSLTYLEGIIFNLIK